MDSQFGAIALSNLLSPLLLHMYQLIESPGLELWGLWRPFLKRSILLTGSHHLRLHWRLSFCWWWIFLFIAWNFVNLTASSNLKLPMKVRLSNAKEMSELYAETWPCNVPYACLWECYKAECTSSVLIMFFMVIVINDFILSNFCWKFLFRNYPISYSKTALNAHVQSDMNILQNALKEQ